MKSVLLKEKKRFQIKSDYWKIFFLCLITAAIIFLPFLIYEKGYFLYYGDFNVQQIPFYLHAHDAVRSGEIFWDWGTDLGANFIGSYTFYLLTSPFFWLTLPFPSEIVPLLMGPLLILKFACAGTTGFAFIKRFTQNNRFAMIGALLYAFCGFNQFNIFFNHFHEAVIVFPLLLVALEEFVINGRRGCFAIAVFACAFINYFFFAGQVVFTILYFIVRCFCPDFPMTVKKFFLLFFEAVLGVILACVVLVPSALAIIENPRTENFYSGMDLLLYRNVQRYGLILESLFFPPDIPSRPNFFPDSNAKWSSVSAYLPLFSMSGVLVFCRSFKKHWLRRILAICGVMALIPILNCAFYAFNSSYYARWYYMPVLMMALATVLALEHTELDFRFGIKGCAIAVACFAVIGIMPSKDDEGVLRWFSFVPYPERFWGYIAIAILSILLLLLLLYTPRWSKKFFRQAAAFTCVIAVISSITVIASGKQHASSDIYHTVVEQGIYGEENFSLDEDEFYRVDEYELPDNMPMYWDMSTIQCFHSIVPASIMEFYETIGVERNVASRPDISYYALRALTSVKYLISEPNENPSLYGFTLIGEQNGYDIYENEYFIPMGFTYDYYADSSVMDHFLDTSLDDLMLSAICLSDEDAETYSDVLERYPAEKATAFDERSYYEACEERAAHSGYSFEYDTHGFTSKIKLDRENLVFYSVPYESGWTAYVNGEETEIVKANIGFMAVLAPAGDNTIEFRYQTPGLSIGTAATVGGVVILLSYVAVMYVLRKKNPEKYGIKRHYHRSLMRKNQTISAGQAYIVSVIKKAKEKESK